MKIVEISHGLSVAVLKICGGNDHYRTSKWFIQVYRLVFYYTFFFFLVFTDY
ncbi:hypothetical protein Hanom_Chr10g00901711 [Helianthus anomalus]